MTRPRIARAKIKAAIPDSGGLIARIAKAAGSSGLRKQIDWMIPA
jgi:hypothetical protein